MPRLAPVIRIVLFSMFIMFSLRSKMALVVQAPHGQVDDCSSHPARLSGSHEDRRVSELRECRQPPRVGPGCERLVKLLDGCSRGLGEKLEALLNSGRFRNTLWPQTDHANPLRCQPGAPP